MEARLVNIPTYIRRNGVRARVVEEAPSRIAPFGGNRHSLYLRSSLVNDSQFPFESGEKVTVRIDGERLLVEAADDA